MTPKPDPQDRPDAQNPPAVQPLKIKYDRKLDIVKIDNQRFSGAFFRAFDLVDVRVPGGSVSVDEKLVRIYRDPAGVVRAETLSDKAITRRYLERAVQGETLDPLLEAIVERYLARTERGTRG